MIEAQISGLPCIVSNNIQNQAIITNNVVKEEYDIEKWKNHIINIKTSTRKIDANDEQISQFSMGSLIKKMTRIYGE